MNTQTVKVFRSNKDTLVVQSNAAVFVVPDTLRIEKEKKELGEDDFDELVSDNLYYADAANTFLVKKKLPIIDIKTEKYIRFIQRDQSFSLVRLDTVPELWCVYFFRTDKKPAKADMGDIEPSYKEYFSK